MTAQPDMSDAEKLRLLADWFDLQDELRGSSSPPEVQDDLRRMADDMDRVPGPWEDYGWGAWALIVFLVAVIIFASLT